MIAVKIRRKRKVCELKSLKENVKSLRLIEGGSIVIGRNKQCEIKDLQCSRRLYEVDVRTDNVYITNLKTNVVKVLQNNEIIEGNGFKYESFIDDELYEVNDETNNECDNETHEQSTGQWEQHDSMYVYKYKGGGQSSPLLAAFDFDDTLVTTKSGKKFAQTEFDWRLIDTKIVQRIRDFTKRNYRFVIFSNQAGISSGAVALKSVQKRFEDAIKRINIPCVALLASKDDIYRKPRPGMFWVYQNSFNDALEISEKFMIGDAAGRKSSIKKDHSAADILFAYNLRFDSFQTPEDFIASKPMQTSVQDAVTLYSTNLPSFRPQSLLEKSEFIACNDSGKYFKSIKELLESLPSKAILFVGLPGSGKSHFFNNHLSKHGYKEISRDRLGSMDKCEQQIKKLISEGETKIVVNNLNLEENGRRKFLQLLPGLVCFYFQSTRSHCLHLNNYRRLMKQMNPDYEYAPVPEPVIYGNEKKLNEPTKDEGFSSVYRISFIVGEFDSEQQEQLFSMYL